MQAANPLAKANAEDQTMRKELVEAKGLKGKGLVGRERSRKRSPMVPTQACKLTLELFF